VVVAVVAAAWLADPAKLGVDLCWFRRLSGLPCPGCGLTRSLLALTQGDLRRSVAFHPFGPLVLGWALAAASTALLRGPARQRLRDALGRSGGRFDRAYRWLVGAFVGFGVARATGVALGLWAAV
jgi:hypothetical protein